MVTARRNITEQKGKIKNIKLTHITADRFILRLTFCKYTFQCSNIIKNKGEKQAKCELFTALTRSQSVNKMRSLTSFQLFSEGKQQVLRIRKQMTESLLK